MSDRKEDSPPQISLSNNISHSRLLIHVSEEFGHNDLNLNQHNAETQYYERDQTESFEFLDFNQKKTECGCQIQKLFEIVGKLFRKSIIARIHTTC